MNRGADLSYSAAALAIADFSLGKRRFLQHLSSSPCECQNAFPIGHDDDLSMDWTISFARVKALKCLARAKI